MTSTILYLALTGLGAPAETELTWRNDYGQARKEAAQTHKPMAVVLGSGRKGWQGFASDGGLGAKAQGILASTYTPVYVDTTSKAGKRLAKSFGMKEGLGIVLSDKTGDLQAFRHEGDLTNAKLVKYLNRYGDPEYVVKTTESNPSHRKGSTRYESIHNSYCPNCGGCANGQCGR